MRHPKQFRATAYPQLLLGHGYTVSARPTRFRVRLRWCEILHHPRRCCDQCRSWCNALHHWRRRCGHCRSWSNALHHWRKCCDHCRSWCDVLRNSRRCCDHGRGWCDALHHWRRCCNQALWLLPASAGAKCPHRRWHKRNGWGWARCNSATDTGTALTAGGGATNTASVERCTFESRSLCAWWS